MLAVYRLQAFLQSIREQFILIEVNGRALAPVATICKFSCKAPVEITLQPAPFAVYSTLGDCSLNASPVTHLMITSSSLTDVHHHRLPNSSTLCVLQRFQKWCLFLRTAAQTVQMFTTRECGVLGKRSVVSVCAFVCVCVSVCNALTFESIDLESLFLVHK